MRRKVATVRKLTESERELLDVVYGEQCLWCKEGYALRFDKEMDEWAHPPDKKHSGHSGTACDADWSRKAVDVYLRERAAAGAKEGGK